MQGEARESVRDGAGAGRSPSGVTLTDGWLSTARCLWIAVAATAVALVVIGFVVALHHPDLITRPTVRSIAATAGISDLLVNTMFLIALVIYAGTGVLIFTRRSDDLGAMLIALSLVAGTGIIVVTSGGLTWRCRGWRCR
jgi:hypothetical protein